MTTILPSPPPIELLALALLSYLAGLLTPWYYAQERMRGLGRWFVNKLPYEPPPGEETDEALRRAVEEGESSSPNDDG